MSRLPASADIEYFLEVATQLNISRAAERLGITQPSLSISLKRLEGSLGTPLFLRSKSGVQLTKAGLHFLQKGQELLKDWERLRSDALRQVSEVGGRFSIGCHAAVARYTLPHFLPQLLKQYPDLELRLEHDLSRKVVEGVISHQIDFGLVVNPVDHPDLVVVDLCRDRVTLWSATGKVSDVLIYDPNLHQSQAIIQKMRSRKNVFKKHLTSTSLEVVADLATAGAGTAILPTRVAQGPGYRLKRCGGEFPHFDDRVALVFRADAQKSMASKTIVAAIRAAITES